MISTRIISTLALAAVVALIAVGCASKPDVVYSKPHRPALPARPTLSRIAPAAFDCPPDVRKAHPELLCISQHTYTVLVNRERKLRDYGQQLLQVILAMTVPWPSAAGGGQ